MTPTDEHQLYPSDQRSGLNRMSDLSKSSGLLIAELKFNDSARSGEGSGAGNVTTNRGDFSPGPIVTGAVTASRHSEERGIGSD